MPGSVRARVSSAAGAERIGATNVFSATVGAPFDTDVEIVQVLAEVAAIGPLAERAIRRGELLTEQLQRALDSRIVIEQAKGAIVQERGVSVDEAFTLIRGYSRSHNLRLSDVARTVTTDLSAIPDLANPQTCPVSLRGSISRRPQ